MVNQYHLIKKFFATNICFSIKHRCVIGSRFFIGTHLYIFSNKEQGITDPLVNDIGISRIGQYHQVRKFFVP